MVSPAFQAPAYLQFYPTMGCNMSCSFCFNRSLPQTPDAHPADVEKMASACSRLGIEHIDFLGGEPTLHPELGRIVAAICRQGLRITLSSNGTRPEVLWALSRQFPEDSLRIGISVNSDTLPHGLDEYIRTRRPILKSVFTYPEPLPGACRPYIGMPGIEYCLIYRDAADAADLENCQPFDVFCNHLETLQAQHPGINGVFCGGFVPDTKNTPELAETRCPAGTTKLSVLPDGSVYPCYLFFRYPEFCLGNILEHDFSGIWHHPVLDFFRRFSGNPCPRQTCRLHPQCHGGCPAMSYLHQGRLDAPDPRCVR